MDATPCSLLNRLRQSASVPADWKRFVDLYTPLLYHWACRLERCDADAADLVQEVFLRLVLKLPDFDYDPRKSFRGWLYTVLRNCWLDRCQPITAATLSPEQLSKLASPGQGDKVDDEDERRHLVTQALRVMQRDFQSTTWQACWATVVEGRRADEVASELGLTVAAVYARTARVMRRLREEFDDFLE